MNYFDKVIAYIRRTTPLYNYNISDFMVEQNNNSVFIRYWNPSFSIVQPTEEQLDTVTQEEYDSSIKKKPITKKIDTFDSEDDVLNSEEGDVININGSLKVYKNGSWTLQQDIQDINTRINISEIKTIVDVGKDNVILTAVQLLSGIIEGNPTGTRTWSLPSAADIINEITNVFVGKTFTVLFSNESPTKKVNISLGSGMTIKKTLTPFQDSITLFFKIDNIGSGTEAITVFKG